MADADVVKRVSIIFESEGAKDTAKAGKDIEDGLKRVGKAGEDALGGGPSGKRGGLRGLFDSAKASLGGLRSELGGAFQSIKGLGTGIAAVGGLFGQFGLAVAGVKAAIELASNAQRVYNDTLSLVPDLAYRARQALGQTSDNFGAFARQIEADAARAGRVVAPLFALGQASQDQQQRAALASLLGIGGGPAGIFTAAGAGLSPFAPPKPAASRGGGGGGAPSAPVDPYAAIAGMNFGTTFAGFGNELKASGDAYIEKSFAAGSDQTLAAKAAEIQAAVVKTEEAFATATTTASGFADVQASTLDAEQVQIWGDITTNALDNVGRSMASAAVQSILLGKGFQAAAKGALVGLTVQAATEAIFQTAKGFALLAVGRPDAAALAFTSAKTFALVGAVAGVGAASLGGFGGGGGGGRAAGPVSSGVGDTARSTPGGQPTQVTVFVGISRREVTDAVVEETTARGTRRGVPRLAMAT